MTKWDYNINIQRIHNQYEEKKISFDEYINEVVREIVLLKERVTQKTLKNELENWIADMGCFQDGKFESYLDNGDEKELELKFKKLYNIGDERKRIWFGI